MSKIIIYFFSLLSSILLSMFGCDPVALVDQPSTNKAVSTIGKYDLNYKVPDITNKGKFLNDLMLSPYWKVERDSKGRYIAQARYVSDDFGMSFEKRPPMFLFSFINRNKSKISKGQAITSEYMSYDQYYSSFKVTIIFDKPDRRFPYCLYKKDEKTLLKVYDNCCNKIGPNSWSDLIIKLSLKNDIYIILHEQGKSKSREKTFEYADLLLKEVNKIAELPAKYYTKSIYSKFYNFRFNNLHRNCCVLKVPAFQSRDTFYGYFKTDKNTDYNGINIKISHPKYCGKNGECTRDYRRIQKAEYLGKPYFNNDLLYFQIEDNAVYLSEEKYDKMFGIFSGKGSFKAKLEVLNEKGKVLYENFYQFKGWER